MPYTVKVNFPVNNYIEVSADKLDELIEEVEEGEMPLESYTWVHGTITEEEKESLISWAKLARQVYTPQLQTTKQ